MQEQCRENEPLARIPESNYQQLQHFISESEWDARAVIKEVARNINHSLESLRGEKGKVNPIV